jgi:S-adenosylmethionine:tRNA ribosyltransferase-isomerase
LNAIVPTIFRKSTYEFHLPPELIAQHPSRNRDQSRLLALDRNTKKTTPHIFRDIPRLLQPGDLLVLNETKVVPAALTGIKPGGGKVDLLVTNPIGLDALPDDSTSTIRICMARSHKPLRNGTAIEIGPSTVLIVEDQVGPGRFSIRFPVDEKNFATFLETWGKTPLPPYIRRFKKEESADRSRYQTVYSKNPGSVAAPTAGLHFTKSLLTELASKKIEIVTITLHVGPGTFTPVRSEDIRDHCMESEYVIISNKSSDIINNAIRRERRIIAVGTTTVRALESSVSDNGLIESCSKTTNLFITPGFDFKVVNGMVTNFHLPGSTLLVLVAAFAGLEHILDAYNVAIQSNFRFYSYGDACLII